MTCLLDGKGGGGNRTRFGKGLNKFSEEPTEQTGQSRSGLRAGRHRMPTRRTPFLQNLSALAGSYTLRFQQKFDQSIRAEITP